MVLVNKISGKLLMCVDYVDLNITYSKDEHPLICIDKMVDNSVNYKLLSFINAYY